MSTTKYEIDDKDQILADAVAEGNRNLDDYNKDMDKALTNNTNVMNNALGQVGIDANGKVTEGSALESVINSQNKSTEFSIDKIEQQKEQAKSDYNKEQAGAYADYRKQVDPYGVQAEQVAASGLGNSGYAESLKMQAYVAYQNRFAVARDSLNRIVTDYDNQIAQARLQNDAVLAEIYTNAMAQRLEIATSFGVKATELLASKASGAASIRQQNRSSYMSLYNQLMSGELETNSQDFKKADEDGEVDEDIAPVGDTVKGAMASGRDSSGIRNTQSLHNAANDANINTRNKALRFIGEHGLETNGLKLLTRKEWRQGRNDGKQGGEYKYDNYGAYLKAYVAWCINNS